MNFYTKKLETKNLMKGTGLNWKTQKRSYNSRIKSRQVNQKKMESCFILSNNELWTHKYHYNMFKISLYMITPKLMVISFLKISLNNKETRKNVS